MRMRRGRSPWFDVLMLLFVATVAGCQPSSKLDSGEDEVAQAQPAPINLIVVADLSDRIRTSGQIQRDSTIIDEIASAFRRRAQVVGYPYCRDRLRFQGVRSTVTSEDVAVDVGALNDKGIVIVAKLPGYLTSWANQARKFYAAEGPFVGADLWGYIAHDLSAVRDAKARNKIIVITDGYLNFASGVARPRNTEMHVAALRQAGARWETQFPRYALAGVGQRFEDCDLLVLEVAPKDPMRNVTEADILRRYWTAWADTLGMRHESSPDQAVLLDNAPLSALQGRLDTFLMSE